jgi:uncharacterized membrane protein YccF (DUF307 family)
MLYALKLFGCIVWAVPWCLAAVICGMTFIGLPLAFLLWIIGCLPYQRVHQKHQEKLYAYKHRDHALEEEGEVPWEM